MCVPSGRFLGIYRADKPEGIYEAVSVPRRCNRWVCKFCGKLKSKQLISRALNGVIVEPVPGFRSRYCHKLVTLTVPGKAYRAATSIENAVSDMNTKFSKLVKVLRKHWGKFDYLKVIELQRDGYPHIHLLIRGASIAHGGILDDIRYYWRHRYGMGNVDIQYLKEDSPRKMVLYVLKYVTKSPANLPKGKRLFVSSRGALAPVKKRIPKNWIIMKQLSYHKCIRLPEQTEILASDSIEGFIRYDDPDLTKLVWDNWRETHNHNLNVY